MSLTGPGSACRSHGEHVFFSLLSPGDVSTLIAPHLKLLFAELNGHIHGLIPFPQPVPCQRHFKGCSFRSSAQLSGGGSDQTERSSTVSSPVLDATSLLMPPRCT